jgi:hypothetical protein
MAPRALVSRIDALVICASPKASCRSVADFAWEVAQTKTVRVTLPARLLVFRNPLRRLISAYLNKYVEHSRYREESLRLCYGARLECFADFVDELAEHGFRCIDKVHFKPQRSRYRWWTYDRIFDAEDLEPLRRFVNGVCGTDLAMPFRVRGNRAAGVRASATIATADAAWLPRVALEELIRDDLTPPYVSFYTPELETKARRIYRSDYRFLDQCLQRGLLDPPLHNRLTRL